MSIAGGGKAPVLISHQRQLSLSVTQVQERLIKNKTLFTAVEPAISCTSLQVGNYRLHAFKVLP